LRDNDGALLRTIINKNGALVAAVLLGAATAPAATHEYHVTLSKDLRQLDVEARFDGGVRSVWARRRDARDYLVAARTCDGSPLPRTGSRLASPSGNLSCLTYSVDLGKAADENARLQAFGQATLVLPVNDWMWRPRLGGADEILVTFDLPQDVNVSVPWQPLANESATFRLLSSPQSGTGLAIFGQFDASVVRIGEAELRVISLPSRGRPVNPALTDWTSQTAANITLAYGRFPNPDARVVLFPVAGRPGGSAVPFGRVVRDGGETIELLVDPDQPEDSFLGDWTATHEFTHLMLPYVGRSDRWVSEGFAQYYQNVLLARAGRYSPDEAWRKIGDGLERGRQSAPHLSPGEAAAAAERNNRMKIYWSGAALALIADIELRQRSGGRESLDVVLDRFQACCLPSRRTWAARELFAEFDRLVEAPLFVDLYDRHANAAGFPDFADYLTATELAEIRATITARRYTGRPGE
jgi:hypothetical protein